MRPVKRPAHFRYLPGFADDPRYHGAGGESIAHRMAKKVLCEAKSIKFISYGTTYEFRFEGTPKPEQHFIGPVTQNDFAIDVVAQLTKPGPPIEGEQALGIEIEFTNALEPDKKAEIRNAKIATVELTLPEEWTSYEDDMSPEDYDQLRRRMIGLHNAGYRVAEWIFPKTYRAPAAIPVSEPPPPQNQIVVAPQPPFKAQENITISKTAVCPPPPNRPIYSPPAVPVNAPPPRKIGFWRTVWMRLLRYAGD